PSAPPRRARRRTTAGSVSSRREDTSSSRPRRGLMATTADAIEPGSRAYRVAPTQRRGEALLLVGPAVLYLIAFSVYPLVTSLIRSFEYYNPRTTNWHWIGLGNYRQLFSDADFWHTLEHTFVFTFGAVAIQV